MEYVEIKGEVPDTPEGQAFLQDFKATLKKHEYAQDPRQGDSIYLPGFGVDARRTIFTDRSGDGESMVSMWENMPRNGGATRATEVKASVRSRLLDPKSVEYNPEVLKMLEDLQKNYPIPGNGRANGNNGHAKEPDGHSESF